jgi:hypothetical protein
VGAENLPKADKKERLLKWGRNFNALGAVAMAGLAIAIPVGAVAFNTLAAVNVAQAGGFEALRRRSIKKSQNKKKQN